MRQIGDGELKWMLLLGLRLDTPATLRNGLASRQHDVRDRAERAIADRLAQRLARLEILTDAPEPPPFTMFGEKMEQTEEDHLGRRR